MDIGAFLTDHLADSPLNTIAPDIALEPALAGLTIYDVPLVGVGAAGDPLFAGLRKKEAVGSLFRLPEEWLPGARSVISCFFPYTRAVRSREDPGAPLPSNAWLHARIEGNQCLMEAGRALKAALEKEGFAAVVPVQTPEFFSVWAPGSSDRVSDPAVSYTSRWSERHVAFVCGLGTFGLSGGLITEKGVCGRFISVVTTAPLPVTERAYSGIYEYCTRCGECARHCPVGAISTENGKIHAPCGEQLNRTKALFAPRYGCGKCQIGVPCSEGIPGR